MITQYRNYTDRELFRQIRIFIECRDPEEHNHAAELLEEICERMPQWTDLYPPASYGKYGCPTTDD